MNENKNKKKEMDEFKKLFISYIYERNRSSIKYLH